MNDLISAGIVIWMSQRTVLDSFAIISCRELIDDAVDFLAINGLDVKPHQISSALRVVLGRSRPVRDGDRVYRAYMGLRLR